ncbi:MAG: N-acetylmuramoyl-L-alanine amidase [Roseovarius sp.]|nr:N-acetylmuramoyl-L-alanine amidase [Roseovarius sp.]
MIVLHYTAMQTAEAALARLCDPGAEVSAHYLISERGEIWQMVEEDQRAWHAGTGQWGAVKDVNSRSIGIELANTGAHPFPEPQMRALEGLMRAIMTRWRILPERVIAHSDMAPARKSDPGARFDWRRLARGGLSVWPEPGRAETGPETGAGAFLVAAERFGYASSGAEDLETILAAFRLRFRPNAVGPLEAVDCAAIQDLATRFPVDRAGPSA